MQQLSRFAIGRRKRRPLKNEPQLGCPPRRISINRVALRGSGMVPHLTSDWSPGRFPPLPEPYPQDDAPQQHAKNEKTLPPAFLSPPPQRPPASGSPRPRPGMRSWAHPARASHRDAPEGHTRPSPIQRRAGTSITPRHKAICAEPPPREAGAAALTAPPGAARAGCAPVGAQKRPRRPRRGSHSPWRGAPAGVPSPGGQRPRRGAASVR